MQDTSVIGAEDDTATELERARAREAATREILEVISQSRADARPAFKIILQNAMRLCGAGEAELHLVDEHRTCTRLVAWLSAMDRPAQVDSHVRLLTDTGSKLIQTIVAGKTIHLLDVRDTERYRQGSHEYRKTFEGQRTTLLVPLMSDGIGIGALCVWHHEVRAFTQDQIGLIETFATQAVVAIENTRQFKALEDRTAEVETLNRDLERRVQAQVGEIERMARLKRFLPAAVADAVISSGSEKMLSSHRALLGVLFCDIRGFTAFCETAEPEETIEVLQTYHEEMGKLINAHRAGVDHRMGDGIMVLFNDPLPCDDPAGEAVRLAIAMRARMAELCLRWKRMGHRLGFGVGVSLGYATVGLVGFEGRFDYTASGTAINLASRLCDEAQDGEILLSPRAGMAVEGAFLIESRGEISFKGIREPLEVSRVIRAATTSGTTS